MQGKNQLWVGIGIGALVLALVAVMTFSLWIIPNAQAQGRIATKAAQVAQATNNAPAAQTQGTTPLPRTITVVGEGAVRIQPDIAQATIGVETVAGTVREATTRATTILQAVLTALRQQGIAEKDIQTSGYSVWVERNQGPDGRPAAETQYRVNSNVNVTIRDLTKIGAVLDAAIEAGANTIYGISFSVDQPERLMSQAREKAVADALAKANEWAKLNGLTVGPVVSLSEIVGGNGGVYNAGLRSAAEMAKGMGGAGVGPFTPGELELSLQIQVVYAIQ